MFSISKIKILPNIIYSIVNCNSNAISIARNLRFWLFHIKYFHIIKFDILVLNIYL